MVQEKTCGTIQIAKVSTMETAVSANLHIFATVIQGRAGMYQPWHENIRFASALSSMFCTLFFDSAPLCWAIFRSTV
jgi:hypothetical protein